MGENEDLTRGLERALERAGIGKPTDFVRLTGGATMESWRFAADGNEFILRRAPSLEFMRDRAFGHDVEAAVIRAANTAGVTAPTVVAELEPEDGIGSGFVMQALPGTPNPKDILVMEKPDQLLREVAADLARIHSLKPADLPDAIPTINYAEAVATLREQFIEAGDDRPIIALGLKWLEENLPEPIEPVLNHGDYRLGNILVEDSHLTGVLDWELAHFGDRHEDLAFGCMAVWRFARYDRPALGLGRLEDYFAAYEAESGRKVDPARFRFWTIYRTVWWALGCLRNATVWREGEDRMLERVVISRRTSENELDLLMLLEEDAPEDERAEPVEFKFSEMHTGRGEATLSELLSAIDEWLETMKGKVGGHDKFQLAVARNALGMAIREEAQLPGHFESKSFAREITSGVRSLQTPGTLAWLRHSALEKLSVDVPKYPALAVARQRWANEREEVED